MKELEGLQDLFFDFKTHPLFSSIAAIVIGTLLIVLVTAVQKWKKRDLEEQENREKAEMARRTSVDNLKRTKGRSRRGSAVPDNFKKTNGRSNGNSRRPSRLSINDSNNKKRSRRESRTYSVIHNDK
jgi:Flp pilus assembly protein TadB